MPARRLYGYLGPDEFKSGPSIAPRSIRSRQQLNAALVLLGGPEPCTFVVDEDGFLRLAPRQTEHVLLAQGRPVLAAGEMTVTLHAQQPVVVAASNQSTGYCPEPASWTAVAAALDALGVVHPGEFTDEFEFRRCPSCRAPNLVKDDWFICAECDSPLPRQWNFTSADR